MQIERIPLSALSPLRDNPRKITPTAIERLKGSIRSFGLFKPLLVWSDGASDYVIGGNQRFSVLRAMDESAELPFSVTLASGAQVDVTNLIPCIRFHGTRAEAKAVALRDNNEDGEWDWDLLPGFTTELSKELEGMGGDVGAMLGFDEAMLESLNALASDIQVGLDRFTSPDHLEHPEAPEPTAPVEARSTAETVTKQGTKFVCGNIRGKIPIPVYNRFVQVFNDTSNRIGSTDIHAILVAMMDRLEEEA